MGAGVPTALHGLPCTLSRVGGGGAVADGKWEGRFGTLTSIHMVLLIPHHPDSLSGFEI